MILILKSKPATDEPIPLPEKLLLIFKQKVEDAEDDQDRERAKRDLAKLEIAFGG